MENSMFFSVKLFYFSNKIAITTKPINSTHNALQILGGGGYILLYT